MEFDEYQHKAWRYDQQPLEPDRGLVIALLGLGGEVGTLQTTQKKVVRDHDGHLDSQSNAVEDLGDILWYVSDAAAWLGFGLGEIADANLEKIKRRWSPHDHPLPNGSRPQIEAAADPSSRSVPLGPALVRDGISPTSERLPRQMTIHLAEIPGSDHRVLPVMDGSPCGNQLGDNAYDPDGYRWHDCFHFAHAAILGWSPVLRALLKLKRKSSPSLDDVEDGGRAVAIEEGITAMVFDAANRAGFFRNVRVVDSDILRICTRLTQGLEVNDTTPLEWEQSIVRGYDAWRTVNEAGHGVIECDLDARTIDARPMTKGELQAHAQIAATDLGS